MFRCFGNRRPLDHLPENFRTKYAARGDVLDETVKKTSPSFLPICKHNYISFYIFKYVIHVSSITQILLQNVNKQHSVIFALDLYEYS